MRRLRLNKEDSQLMPPTIPMKSVHPAVEISVLPYMGKHSVREINLTLVK